MLSITHRQAELQRANAAGRPAIAAQCSMGVAILCDRASAAAFGKDSDVAGMPGRGQAGRDQA